MSAVDATSKKLCADLGTPPVEGTQTIGTTARRVDTRGGLTEMTVEMNEELNIQAVARHVAEHGPQRVLVDNEGDATTWRRAWTDHKIQSDVIFIRNDGWSLGAPMEFAEVAFQLWVGDWIGFIKRPEKKAREIEEWPL